MYVISLGIGHLSDSTFFISAAHFKAVIHIAVIFGIRVDKPGLLDRLDEFNRLRHSFARKHLAHDVLSGVQAAYRKGRVLRCIVREHNGIHIVLNKIFEVVEQRDFKPCLLRFCLCLVKKRLVFVAHRHKLRVWMVKQHLHHVAPARTSEYSDSQFP